MAKRYDFAIRLGLRSLIQLQFDGDDDAFYVAREIRRYVEVEFVRPCTTIEFAATMYSMG